MAYLYCYMHFTFQIRGRRYLIFASDNQLVRRPQPVKIVVRECYLQIVPSPVFTITDSERLREKG